MVVGNGLVAKKFEEYANNDSFLIFASGVSNSKSTIQAEYTREVDLLKYVSNENKEKTLIYFSTCSVKDPEENKSAYVAHKKSIEDYIISSTLNYTIFRVSNLVGKSANPNTILNFIANSVCNNTHFNLWLNASRNLIDVDDFFLITDHILKNKLFLNSIVNVAYPENYAVSEIVRAVEKYFNKTANYTSIPKGCNFSIDISQIASLLHQLNLNFNKNYLELLLSKYY